MDKTIEQVKQLAHRCGVPKLILFGSRARGDHHARSDYDFAIWGCTPQQRAQFSDAVENDLDSLYSVDLVFVSEHTDAALLQNIEKDGICLLDRYNTNFENLTNAVERLHEGVQAYQENPAKIIRDGVIQRFEFTCELAWKTTREFLLDKLIKQRYKLALNLRVNFLCGCIIINVRGLVAGIQQCNPRLFIVN